jgi:hypothetical protein
MTQHHGVNYNSFYLAVIICAFLDLLNEIAS